LEPIRHNRKCYQNIGRQALGTVRIGPPIGYRTLAAWPLAKRVNARGRALYTIAATAVALECAANQPADRHWGMALTSLNHHKLGIVPGLGD
jgi:hypothetical protein